MSSDAEPPTTRDHTDEHSVAETDDGNDPECDTDNQSSTHDRDPANGPSCASFHHGPYQPKLRFSGR